MIWIISILTYILGYFISFGIITWMQGMVDLPYIKYRQPEFQKAWHNPTAVFVSLFSWLGVALVIYVCFQHHKTLGFKLSYAPLWNEWIKANNL